jgi:hypothetical protein
MKFIGKSREQEGGATFFYIVVGMVLMVGVIYALNYYRGQKDITIHVPQVQVK